MTAVTVTVTEAPTAIEQAQAIRREVMETPWPPSREARWAVGWALGELDDILAVQAPAPERPRVRSAHGGRPGPRLVDRPGGAGP